MQYSLPYIIFIVFILGIAAFQLGMPIEEKSRKYINFTVVLAYVLFLGFRGFIATDWINYYPFFKDLPTDFSLALKKNSYETGFVLYSVLIKKISTDYVFFQLINTLTNLCLLQLFFKRYLPVKYYALGFAVFLVFYGNGLEISLLRNFKAILLFLIALPYIEHRKPFKYFFLVIIAFFFHWSSIFYFPLYFFLHKKIPIKIFLITFILGSLVYLLHIQYISPIIKLTTTILPQGISEKVLIYMGSEIFTKSYGLTFGFFERTITAFLVLFYYNKIQTNRSNILFVNSLYIYISLYLFCSEITIVLERVACIFAFSYWILIPAIVQNAERKIKPLLTFFFALLIISKMYMTTNSIFYDYDSFLLGKSKTYNERYEIFKKNNYIINKK